MDYAASIEQLRLQLWNLMYASWLGNLFTPKWFALVALVIGAYAVWWLRVDKTRLRTLLLYGSFIAVIRIILDVGGHDMGLWAYSVSIFPISPTLFTHDLTVTPLAYMLVYQYAATWKQFWLYNALVSAAVFFGLLPLFSYFGMLKLYNWNYFYSFAIIFLAAGVMRGIMLAILHVEQAARSRVNQAGSIRLTAQPAMKPAIGEDDGDDEID